VTLKVMVRGAFSIFSGYGNDCLGIARALLRAGVDVYLDPLVLSPPLPPDIAGLLTKELKAPFDLAIHHVDPGQLGQEPHVSRASQCNVAWTMWERSTLDDLNNRGTLRRRLQTSYDLVVSYDDVTSGALEPYCAPSRQYRKGVSQVTVQGGFWPEDWPYFQRNWGSPGTPEDRFAFCMLGQLHQRKDPFVALEAFRELKEEHPVEFEPAELHLKTNLPGLHGGIEAWVPKVRVYYDVWSQAKVMAFYRQMHVLLAPSRGEGKNMPALEFQSTGAPVIATAWGGHTQWLSENYAYPLDFTLVPVRPSLPQCLEARASKEHLKALMLETFRNRGETRLRGFRAAQAIPARCSWDVAIRRLLHHIGYSAPGAPHVDPG
jgi:glycosyltransferase involved in cell wall biosynthesis